MVVDPFPKPTGKNSHQWGVREDDGRVFLEVRDFWAGRVRGQSFGPGRGAGLVGQASAVS